MPRWDRYVDVFGATCNAVITSHLFCDVLKTFIVPRLITLTHNTFAQTIRCASMLCCRSHVESSVCCSQWHRWTAQTWSELGTDTCRVFTWFYGRESLVVVVLSAVFNCHPGLLASSLHHRATQTPLSVNGRYYTWPVIATCGPSDFSVFPESEFLRKRGGFIRFCMYIDARFEVFGAGRRYTY
jgi:hypothetical protein